MTFLFNSPHARHGGLPVVWEIFDLSHVDSVPSNNFFASVYDFLVARLSM